MEIRSLEAPGRFDVLKVLLAAILATALALTAVRFLIPGQGVKDFLRSPIQYVTTLCFWITMFTLAMKHVRSSREQRAYSIGEEILDDPEFEFTLTWMGADRVRQKFAHADHEDYHDTVVFTTILNGLDRLRKTQSTSELDDYFRTRCDVLSGELETSYAGIRYLIWLLPTLGFIGTVWGIGRGLSKFAGIIRNAAEWDAVRDELPGVTTQLGTAFDTTLLALVLSALALLYMSWMLKRDEHILEKISMLCLDGVCALFEEHTRESEELIEALQQSTEKMRTAMNGNRADLANVIQERLPALIGNEVGAKLDTLGAHTQKTHALLAKLVILQSKSSEQIARILQGAPQDTAPLKDELEDIKKLLVAIRDSLTALGRRPEDRDRRSGDEG